MKRRCGRKNEGEVVEIIERYKTDFIGVVKISERFAFVMIDDRKMLHDIFVPLTDLNGAKNGQKVQVTITDWPEEAKNPIGKVINILGEQGENNAEMNAILAPYEAMSIGECPCTPDRNMVVWYVSARQKRLNKVFQFDVVDIGQGRCIK